MLIERAFQKRDHARFWKGMAGDFPALLASVILFFALCSIGDA
jgi:hypothetical protein